MKYGLGIDDIVARERHLTRRATALKMLAATAAAAGTLGVVIALLGTGGASAAVIAGSPLVLALVAGPSAFVTDVQLRRVRLVLAALADRSVRHEHARATAPAPAPRRERAPSPPARPPRRREGAVGQPPAF
jgi:hypothetical protein